jgi:hypothetical protein
MNDYFTVENGTLFSESKPQHLQDAWDRSIAKWQMIVDSFESDSPIVDDGGHTTCGLCQLYWINDCKGCPIRELTGKTFCADTPYEQWVEIDENDHEALHIEAKNELDFLKQVRHLNTTHTQLETKHFYFNPDTRGISPKDMTFAEHEAIDIAIEKWEFIAQLLNNGYEVIYDGGISTCALCRLYINNDDCDGCPVSAATKVETCISTPYVDFVEYRGEYLNSKKTTNVDTKRLARIAEREVEFLRSLK